MPLKETLRGFKRILNGECDELPESAFLFAGTINLDYRCLLYTSLKLRLAQDAPHLQKQRRHGAHAFAFQHQGRVLPAAILFYVVDVLICQIHAAGKTHLAINDQNFAVVAVVVVGGNKGRDRREHLALDAPVSYTHLDVYKRQGYGCDGPASPPQRCSRRLWAQ